MKRSLTVDPLVQGLALDSILWHDTVAMVLVKLLQLSIASHPLDFTRLAGILGEEAIRNQGARLASASDLISTFRSREETLMVDPAS